MAKKTAKPAAKPKADPSGLYEALEDCWAGGSGYLAKGDVAYLTSDRAAELLKEKKVKAK